MTSPEATDPSRPLTLEIGPVDLERGIVHRPDGLAELTTKERALLVYLVARPGESVSRDELLREVWGFRSRIPNSRAPDFAMRRLREKIEVIPSQPRHLLTVHGEGYRFVEGARPSSSAPPPSVPHPPGAPYAAEHDVPRPDALAAALHLLSHPGAPLVITGPARIGKTWFLDHLLETQPTAADVVVRVETDQLEPVPGDASTSPLEQLAVELACAIPGGEDALVGAWAQAGHERRRLTRFLERVILPAVPGRLFLALDGADRWSSALDPSGFFGMLRSWASLRREPWSALRVLLTISTDPALLVPDARLSPFNLAPPVRLGGLPRDSLDALAVGAVVSRDELDALHRLTDGHAELVRRALYAISTGAHTAAEVLAVEDLRAEPFGSFLRHRLEALEHHPELARAVAALLFEAQEPAFDATTRLLAAGVLKRSGGRLIPSSPLLERYLLAHLRP